MREHIIERSIVPFTPAAATTTNKEKYNIFAPLAAAGKIGMAAFDLEQFVLQNSIVSLKLAYLQSVIDDRIDGKLPDALPSIDEDDEGMMLGVSGGKWAKVPPPEELPSVTVADDGKFLGVQNGKWSPLDMDEAAPYDGAVNVDEGATNTFTDDYTEGYEDGYAVGSAEGGVVEGTQVTIDGRPLSVFAADEYVATSLDERLGNLDTALDSILELQAYYTGATFDEIHEYAEGVIAGGEA